ncbi:MAG: hypothetical protein AB7G07_10905 [Bauldia sp.]
MEAQGASGEARSSSVSQEKERAIEAGLMAERRNGDPQARGNESGVINTHGD